MSRNKDGNIDFYYSLAANEEKGQFPVTLKTFDSITLQNIYRTLCKYALSVIDRQYLSKFTDTLAWIKGEKNVVQLPLVAVLKSHKLVTSHPKITVFIRTDMDYSVPFAVCEFRCMYLTFVFIIPLSAHDNGDFVNKDEYSYYWKFFKHCNQSNEWEFVDFSNNTKKDCILQMDIKSSTVFSIKHI